MAKLQKEDDEFRKLMRKDKAMMQNSNMAKDYQNIPGRSRAYKQNNLPPIRVRAGKIIN